MMDPLRNPADPLHRSGPEAGIELFRRVGQLANGFPSNAVADAAYNLIINIVRTQCSSWRDAEALYDELMAKSKQILRNHYDVLGVRRNVFPYDQHVAMDLHTERDH